MTTGLRGAALRLILVAASLLVSVGTVELIGRAVGWWHPQRTFRYNAVRGYELTPGLGDVNSLGLRGHETDLTRRAGVRRIVLLGDSFTYGDGVTVDEAMPAQLERRLNRDAATPVEVLNLGVPGYNTVQEYACLKELGLRLAPDLVIVAFTLSDADRGAFDSHSAAAHRTLIRVKEFFKAHVGLYDFVRLQIRGLQEWSFRNDPAVAVWPEMYPLVLATRGQPSPGWDECANALRGIATDCRRARTPLLLVIWPVLERLTDYPYRAEHDFIAVQAGALGIPVLDLAPTFMGGDPDKLCVSDKNPHPNATAHHQAAQAVAEFLGSHAELFQSIR